jgi:hypothetical protein
MAQKFEDLNLKEQWVKHSIDLSHKPALFYSGARKILRPVRLKFTSLDDSLQLSDSGYTSAKMRMLEKNYLHEESKDVAIQLWNKRRGQAKYGSVGFTCYNHFVKGGSIDAKRSKRASVFGPCIQSVTLTWLDKNTVGIDVPYRTTEFYKKFPADLVFLRDVLLSDFELPDNLILYCHFANVTIHPMYAVTVMPHIDDPVDMLEDLREEDPYFWKWIIRWTARYLCPEHAHGIKKFSQALRVAADAENRLDEQAMKTLQKYCREEHPGYSRSTAKHYEEHDEE